MKNVTAVSVVPDTNLDNGNIQRSTTGEQIPIIAAAAEKTFFQSIEGGSLNDKQSQVAADIIHTIVTAPSDNQSNQVFLGCLFGPGGTGKSYTL